MIVNLSFKIDERNSGNIFIGVEREWREKEKREQVGKKITMVELSRIFHERSRGRGNGAANENGSRQGKLIRSGAMTREKRQARQTSGYPSRSTAIPDILSLSLSLPCVFHPFAIFLNLPSILRLHRRKRRISRKFRTCRIRGLFVRREGSEFVSFSSYSSSSCRCEKGDVLLGMKLSPGLILG